MGASNVTLASTILQGAGSKGAKRHPAGVAIIAGQVLYFDAATQTAKLAIATSAAAAAAIGWALNTAAIGQPVNVHEEGPLTGASGLEAGEPYVVSDDVAGAMMKADDLGAGDFSTFLGIPSSATVFQGKPFPGGVAHA